MNTVQGEEVQCNVCNQQDKVQQYTGMYTQNIHFNVHVVIANLLTKGSAVSNLLALSTNTELPKLQSNKMFLA